MIEKTEKMVALYLKNAFKGDATVQRYRSDDNSRFVDIIKARHSDNITYLGTIGGYLREMPGAFFHENKVRIEIVSAISVEYESIMAESLSSMILMLDSKQYSYFPEMVVENTCLVGNSSCMKHIFLCDPFLWDDGLPSISSGSFSIAFLYALPISDSEKNFFNKHGATEFSNLLEKKSVEYFNLMRPSCC